MEIKKVFVVICVTVLNFLPTYSEEAYKDLTISVSGQQEKVLSEQNVVFSESPQKAFQELDTSISSKVDVPIEEEAKDQTSFGDFLNPPPGYFCTKTYVHKQRIVRYAKKIYNEDSEELLSQDGDDIVVFLGMAKDFYLDIISLGSSIRLFTSKYKSCDLVDYTVAEQILKPMPDLLRPYLDRRRKEEHIHLTSMNELEKEINTTIETKSEKTMKQQCFEPDVFASNLSDDVTKMVKESFEFHREEAEARDLAEKLRQINVRFIDTLINKLIWYEDNYEGIWSSVSSIADKLHVLGVEGIITDQDDLDDLWDSLTRRFCWFIDLKGSVLPMDFYEQIEDDIENHVITFLEAEEPEGLITRKELLKRAISRAKAKVIAFTKQGIVTDQLEHADAAKKAEKTQV